MNTHSIHGLRFAGNRNHNVGEGAHLEIKCARFLQRDFSRVWVRAVGKGAFWGYRFGYDPPWSRAGLGGRGRGGGGCQSRGTIIIIRAIQLNDAAWSWTETEISEIWVNSGLKQPTSKRDKDNFVLFFNLNACTEVT